MIENNNQIKIFCSKDWFFDSAQDKSYELLDTGEGEKLERFGKYIFVRPYEDAVWKKTLSNKEWEKSDGKFWSSKTGAKKGWTFKNKITEKWEMEYKGIKFLASPTPFRHLGFFPEQASHWDFIEEKLLGEKAKNFSPLLHPSGGTFRLQNSSHSSPPKFLNLFGYTGVASLFALRAGAEVTHLDASKQTLNWVKENQKISGLENLPMRIIEDDPIKFLEREEKRGNKYDAIIMDPPKFGRGPKGEVWKLEEMLPKLLSQVQKVLSDKPLFVILTSYAVDSSVLSLGYALSETMKDFKGEVEVGELCVLEKSNKRLISLANTAIWTPSLASDGVE
ncbi:MAG: class I SAM-dependent methyltransferase [Candidatus Pacebacteria bacterium]|nr:class I SAM-dependent methyltransferase [Candidatus Paceibacterota bacterium]